MKSIFIQSVELNQKAIVLYKNPSPFLECLETFIRILYPDWVKKQQVYEFFKTSEEENGWSPPSEFFQFESKVEEAKLEVKYTKRFIHEPIGDSFSVELTDIIFLFNCGTYIKLDGRICYEGITKMSLFVSATEEWVSNSGKDYIDVLPQYFQTSFASIIAEH
jgi:hypothetical protein